MMFELWDKTIENWLKRKHCTKTNNQESMCKKNYSCLAIIEERKQEEKVDTIT